MIAERAAFQEALASAAAAAQRRGHVLVAYAWDGATLKTTTCPIKAREAKGETLL